MSKRARNLKGRYKGDNKKTKFKKIFTISRKIYEK